MNDENCEFQGENYYTGTGIFIKLLIIIHISIYLNTIIIIITNEEDAVFINGKTII